MLESNPDGSVRLLKRSVAGIPEEEVETEDDAHDTSTLPLGPEPDLKMTKILTSEEFEPPRKEDAPMPIATIPDRFKASVGSPAAANCVCGY